jgi:predicted TIM-barrel fold metal-dependent hydrolase
MKSQRSADLIESATPPIDGDGHVWEDVAAIVRHLPDPYREWRTWELGVAGGTCRLFPPIGYLASMPFVLTQSSARDPRESGRDPDSWEYFLDAVGLQSTVLYPNYGLTIGRVRDLDYAIALTRAYNDWLAETYLRHPSGRFQAAALLPLQVPAAAAVELERAVTELGFCAGVLPANGLPTHLGAEQFLPVYEAAQALDVGLACHGGDGHDGLGLDDLNVFAPVHALGHPFSLLVNLAGMLFNGVFDRFPRLRVAFLEGGAAWTLLAAERFSESFAALRPAATARVLQLPEGVSVRDHMVALMHDDRLVFGCEGGEAHLTTAIDDFGCAPFMYSSDFPHEVSAASCRKELDALDALPIDDAAKADLRGGTAQRFYRLAPG